MWVHVDPQNSKNSKIKTCIWIVKVWLCLHLQSHLAYCGQRARVVPLSTAVSLQWASVPKGAFLLQSIIQNVILLAAPALKSIEIHSVLHGRLVLKASSRPAAAALGMIVVRRAAESTLCQAEIHVMWWLWWPASVDHSHTVWFPAHLGLFFSPFLRTNSLLKNKVGGSFFFKQSLSLFSFFFAVQAIWFMVCQKISNAWETATSLSSTCLEPFSLSVSQWG